MSKRLALAAALATSTALLSACGGTGGSASAGGDCTPAHEFSTLSEGKLTVSAYDLPPFTRVEGDQLKGVDGAILDEIAAMECLDVVVQPAAASAVIPAVQTGRADVAAAGTAPPTGPRSST